MKVSRYFFILLLTIAISSVALGDYRIVWSTIDGGAGASSGGKYSLTATIGQADAGYSQGGSYEMLGGFWTGGPLCLVDLKDFALFAEYWLETGAALPADLDGSSIVDMTDLAMLVNRWLCTCPYGWPLK